MAGHVLLTVAVQTPDAHTDDEAQRLDETQEAVLGVKIHNPFRHESLVHELESLHTLPTPAHKPFKAQVSLTVQALPSSQEAPD
jgi:hypothetical protein